jgi:hypothetical protein
MTTSRFSALVYAQSAEMAIRAVERALEERL